MVQNVFNDQREDIENDCGYDAIYHGQDYRRVFDKGNQQYYTFCQTYTMPFL